MKIDARFNFVNKQTLNKKYKNRTKHRPSFLFIYFVFFGGCGGKQQYSFTFRTLLFTKFTRPIQYV